MFSVFSFFGFNGMVLKKEHKPFGKALPPPPHCDHGVRRRRRNVMFANFIFWKHQTVVRRTSSDYCFTFTHLVHNSRNLCQLSKRKFSADQTRLRLTVRTFLSYSLDYSNHFSSLQKILQFFVYFSVQTNCFGWWLTSSLFMPCTLK